MLDEKDSVEVSKLIAQIQALKDKNIQLKKELDISNEQKIEYLHKVSHQLVAPLNAIEWHIENLTSGRITNEDRLRKVLQSIYSQATIAVHLAKNFALMSNLEGDINLNSLREPLEQVPLHRLMVNLVNDIQPLAWDKSIKITVIDKPLESAPPVLAMKNLISQAFSNIIENAAKYSVGNTVIEINGSYDAVNKSVKVNITNHGIKLLPEEASRIFDRGFRGKEAVNKYPAGTGYGLYIANRIITIHEGGISVSMKPDGLITFTITLFIDKLQGKARKRD